jgi:hypothetical protein
MLPTKMKLANWLAINSNLHVLAGFDIAEDSAYSIAQFAL